MARTETSLATTRRSPRRPSRSCSRAAGGARGPDEFRYYIDRSGAQHFNFKQRLWIVRSVAMAFTPVRTTALETLAINLLALASPESTARRKHCRSPAHLRPLARDFCEQCLLGAPQEGWVLPRPAIQAWMQGRQR